MTTPRPRRLPARLIAALLAFHAATAARAALVIEITPVGSTVPNAINAAPGSTGQFDVRLANRPANSTDTASYSVAGHSFRLSLTGIAGVRFTGVSIAAPDYIYTLSATVVDPTTPFSFDTFPNTTFMASDAEFGAPSRIIASGASYVLGRVSFEVDAGVAGTGALSFLDLGGATSLSDENGGAVPFTAPGGTLTIASAPVPEPASLALTFAGVACAAATAHARRKARA